MENHHFQWANPLFQWQFSIATTTSNQWESMETMGQAVASTTAQPEPGTAARDAGALLAPLKNAVHCCGFLHGSQKRRI